MTLIAVTEEEMIEGLSSFLRQFTPRREMVGSQYRLKLDGHDSIPFWAPRRKRPFRRFMPSGDLYEPVTTGVMSYLLKQFPVQCVFDVGAYSGYFSLVAASFQGKNPSIHAFEMNPARHGRMESILRKESYTDSVSTHLAGMSDRSLGPKTVWHSMYRMFEEKPSESEYREAWWRRLKFAMRGIHGRDDLHEAVMEITTIDEAARRYGAPQLIKIDVDGYEAKVIPGGITVFREQRPFLLFELHKTERLERLGATRQSLMSMLFDCGYRALTFSDHHDCSNIRVERVTIDSLAIKREKTDLFFLY